MPKPPRALGLTTSRILLALADGERHGYAIMRDLRSDGLGAALGPGTLYRTIDQLLEEKLIVESSSASSASTDERRRYFRLTPAGRRALAREAARLSELVKRAASKGLFVPARGQR
jgi:DNA-binding PadR family transcriptional regulator